LAMGVNFPYLSCLSVLGIPFPPPDFRKGRFNNESSGIRQVLKWLVSPASGFSFRQTNLPFYLADPLPAIANALEYRWPGLARFVYRHVLRRDNGKRTKPLEE
jgi:hypothetical protein